MPTDREHDIMMRAGVHKLVDRMFDKLTYTADGVRTCAQITIEQKRPGRVVNAPIASDAALFGRAIGFEYTGESSLTLSTKP